MKRRSKVPEERSRDRIEDYKKEFRRLKKENEQLRKQIYRLQNRDLQLKELYEEFEVEAAQTTEVRTEDKYCPKCGSESVTILSGIREGIDYYDCGKCSSRGRYGKGKK